MIAEPDGRNPGLRPGGGRAGAHKGTDPRRCHGPGSGAAIARTEAGRDMLRKGFSVPTLEWKGTEDGFPPGSELRAFVDSKDPSGADARRDLRKGEDPPYCTEGHGSERCLGEVGAGDDAGDSGRGQW